MESHVFFDILDMMEPLPPSTKPPGKETLYLFLPCETLKGASKSKDSSCMFISLIDLFAIEDLLDDLFDWKYLFDRACI